MKNVAKRLCRIAAALGPQDTIADSVRVRRLIGTVLVAEGVAVTSRFEVLYREDVPGRTARTALRWTVRVILTLVDSESGEHLVCEAPGTGMDAAKAFAAAELRAYATAFGLAVADAPEADEAPAKTDPEPAPKVLRLTTQPKVSTPPAPAPAPRKKVSAIWDELAAVRDQTSLQAWFTAHLPAILRWSEENKAAGWARVVAHCARFGFVEEELVAIRTAAINSLDRVGA